MMNHRLGTTTLLCCLPALAACLEHVPPPAGRTVQIAVAPLALPNVEEVCFGLTVYNGMPAAVGTGTVWSNGNVCSGRYGNAGGGDISYVGPCDADTPSATDNFNYVKLVLNSIEVPTGQGSHPAAGAKNFLDDQATAYDDAYSNDGDPDFQNPCIGDAGCVLKFECKENEDVLVEFNLTVLVDADQGFFDIAVNFDDIFCSAKFDTCSGTSNEWIQLLHRDKNDDGIGDERWDTGVLGFACTGGPGADTHLYLDGVTIACNTGTFQLDPSQSLAGNVAAPADQDVVFGYATYFGDESLSCVGASGESTTCNKRYWNMSIGFNTDEAHRFDNDACTLYASATASDGVFAPEWVSPARTAYPVVRFAVPLTVQTDLTLNCGRWALDGSGAGYVSTRYTALDCESDALCESARAGTSDCDFCHHFGAAGPEQSSRAECVRSGHESVCSTVDERFETCEGAAWLDAVQAGYDDGYEAGAAAECTWDPDVRCCSGGDCYCSEYCESQCGDMLGAYAEGYNSGWHEANAGGGDCVPCAVPCAPNTTNNATGGTVAADLDERVVTAVIPPLGFVDGIGNALTGEGCNVSLAVSDGGSFDGNFALSDGETFEPMTMVELNFTTIGGAAIQVAFGSAVSIRLPLPEGNNGFAQPGDRVDFFRYDAASSQWLFAAEGVVMAGAGGLLDAVASVTHFSWYGVGYPTSNASKSCVKVRVVDSANQPVGDVVLRASSGSSYYQQPTGASGVRCLQSRANSANIISVVSAPAGFAVPAAVTLPANASASCLGSGSSCQLLTFVLAAPACDPAQHTTPADCGCPSVDCGSSRLCSVSGTCVCPAGTAWNGATCESTLAGFVAVAPGTFTMGSPLHDGLPGSYIGSTAFVEDEHVVTLTRSFWIQTTEVTQAQWNSLLGGNPSGFQLGPDHPVENMTWYSAAAYANWASTNAGLPSCYTLSGCTGSLAAGTLVCSGVAFAGVACTGYRLPTEAEWEYAARAGTTTATYDGNLTSTECAQDLTLPAIAWFCGDIQAGAHSPVGLKQPNAWGLYDMLGNVAERVGDWYTNYPAGPVTDPIGPTSGSRRVFRGGSIYQSVQHMRCASRNHGPPEFGNSDVGFRLARTIP